MYCCRKSRVVQRLQLMPIHLMQVEIRVRLPGNILMRLGDLIPITFPGNITITLDYVKPKNSIILRPTKPHMAYRTL